MRMETDLALHASKALPIIPFDSERERKLGGRLNFLGRGTGRQTSKMRNYMNGILITFGTFALIALSAAPGQGQATTGQAAQGGQAAPKPTYTMPEFNAFTTCQGEKDPTTQVQCFDDFVSKYPKPEISSLMGYVYGYEYVDYGNLKNYQKEIEVADELIALDSVEAGDRAKAAIARLQAFQAYYTANPNMPDAQAQLAKDRDLAVMVPNLLKQIPARPGVDMTAALKPAYNIVDDQAGWADLQLKDYPSAVTAYKDALVNSATDAPAAYYLGQAYLAMNPPQTLDGFWAIARSINLKIPKADQVQQFLRSRIQQYEQPGCDSQVDDQLKEMLQLSANSPDRPSTYTIPSAADLSQIRGSSTILTIMADLSGGGDKAKMTWLATCGSELPGVSGKIIDVQTGDSTVDFMVNTGATPEEMTAATTANMDVKVYTATPATPPPTPPGAQPVQIKPQPDVTRLQKDDPITWSGTIVSYDPSPFMLHWDQVTVDPASIPAEKAAPGHHAAPKAPAKKP